MSANPARFEPSISLFVIALFGVCLVFTSASRSQSPQANQQQRPRSVGANQNKNSSPPASQNNNVNDEVGEGDVVRVETQLVTVPAVASGRLLIASNDGVVYCFGEKR
jgi:flagellar biosynthesis component FlhA